MRLIASAPTIEDLLKCAIQFYCGSAIRFESVGKSWDVYNAKGKIEGVEVVRKANRYRLQAI